MFNFPQFEKYNYYYNILNKQAHRDPTKLKRLEMKRLADISSNSVTIKNPSGIRKNMTN